MTLKNLSMELQILVVEMTFQKKQNYLNILYACTKQYHLIISMFNSPGMKVKDFTFLGKIHRIFSTSQSEVQSVAGGFSRAALNPCQWGPEP